MPLESLLKLLAAAKFPLVAAAFGLVLNFGGSNAFLKNSGLNVALLATGTAAATMLKKDGQLAEIRQLEARHSREQAVLKTSTQNAMKDAATAQQAAQQRENSLNQMKGELTQLGKNITELKAERERIKKEALSLSQLANGTSAELATCSDDNSILAGQIESLNIERMQLIYELYETAITEADLNSAIAGLETQFKNDSAYQLTQKKKIKSEWVKARAGMHTQLSEANERIEELETALEEKTKLAQNIVSGVWPRLLQNPAIG